MPLWEEQRAVWRAETTRAVAGLTAVAAAQRRRRHDDVDGAGDPRSRRCPRWFTSHEQGGFPVRLDVLAVRVIRIAREAAGAFDRLLASRRQNGDAVPALLAVPNRAVAGIPYRFGEE